MKYFATFVYWVLAALLLSAVLLSFGYDFDRALFIATALLPGMFCAKLLLPDLATIRRRRTVVVLSLVAGVLALEWLMLFGVCTLTQIEPGSKETFPAVFLNPVFILILLVAFVVPEMLLSRWLESRLPRMKTLSFISERRKVTVEVARIAYVESNDDEVLLHTADGCTYRTKTRISQWESMLDDRFMRIHRAYLVNTEQVTGAFGGRLTVQDRTLEVSRRYRDSVAERFPTPMNSNNAAAAASGSSRNPM